MATRTISPGAALLRSSRMFSLPKPLSPPATDGSSNYSDTATIPFPLQQAITTPQSSRSQGDWGLKRPLPLRTTLKSSTPAIRVKAIDAIEQITDFTSAGDHAISLKKFQELNLPLSVPSPQKAHMKVPVKSVFEEIGDFTARDAGRHDDAKDHRWKFRGPWLSGMADGAFRRWLEKDIRARRGAFRQFLKVKLAAELNEEDARRAFDNGGGTAAVEVFTADIIEEDELTDYIRRLRYDRQKLYDFVGEFLDLAPIKPDESLNLWGSNWTTKQIGGGNPWAKDGPPPSHPSAGISYLRTDAYMDNHPVYGPQKSHPPVKARFVIPRNTSTKNARVGIGGFVANAPDGHIVLGTGPSRGVRIEPSRFDPDVVGGPKAYVRLLKANIDPQGKVMLHVGQADPEATIVAEEMAGEAEVYNQQPPPPPPADDDFSSPPRRRQPASSSIMGSGETYGLPF